MMQAVQPQPHLQLQFLQQAAALPASQADQLVVIDDGMTVPQAALDTLGNRAIALSLSPQHNAIKVIADVLRQHSAITCLHLVAQERDNQIWLGDILLDAQAVERYSWDFQDWFSSSYSRMIVKRPQIHVYCQSAGHAAFKLSVLNPLALLTGADIFIA